MKIIKLLVEKIEDEAQDAHEYAELALKYRESYPETADIFYKLSMEEMTHVNALHKDVVRHIEKYKQKSGEPPAAMKAVYEYLHERHLKAADKISVLQCRYKK